MPEKEKGESRPVPKVKVPGPFICAKDGQPLFRLGIIYSGPRLLGCPKCHLVYWQPHTPE